VTVSSGANGEPCVEAEARAARRERARSQHLGLPFSSLALRNAPCRLCRPGRVAAPRLSPNGGSSSTELRRPLVDVGFGRSHMCASNASLACSSGADGLKSQ
jgi:hypothetical protein